MACYRELLAGVEGIHLPFAAARGEPAYHICAAFLDEPGARQRCIDALRACGIQTSVHYRPVHMFRYYRERFGTGDGMLPLTEAIGARELTLPLHPGLGRCEVGTVVRALETSLEARLCSPLRETVVKT